MITGIRNFFRPTALFDALMEGVLLIRSNGQIDYANSASSKMAGPSSKELLARCKALAKLACKQQETITDSITLNDKTFIELVVVPQSSYGSSKKAYVILQDKSSQRQVVDMGKEFIASASHELRTPITIIKGFAETLQDLKDISSEMLAQITEKIVRNCTRMDALVKSLLTLADLDNIPKNRFQPCDLVALVESCAHLLQTVSPTTQLEIKKSHDHLMISADPDLLERALMNLLENGVKYSTPPAHLTVSLISKNGFAEIDIQDQGIGIPASDLPHIFDRFYTVNKAHSRRLGGAGLGLSIVKMIIEKHDGTIMATSELGQGTTFALKLPNSYL